MNGFKRPQMIVLNILLGCSIVFAHSPEKKFDIQAHFAKIDSLSKIDYLDYDY